MSDLSAAKADQYRQDIRNSLEKLRGAIFSRVPPREQAQFLDVVDRIQEQILGTGNAFEQVHSSIQLSRDTTRRILRTKPIVMVELLNELDGIEEEVTALFQLLTRGPDAPG
jgi:bifunctional N-acetylglucosamine-1-phosphate-uridyltransferase/glucosamine-1-phosphate-acetyltransferase GlmU-like protein